MQRRLQITEDRARFEQKYQSAEVLPSFHNFVILSNTQKAVQIPNEERRFFMLTATRKHYTAGQWSELWAAVKDPTFQALFFHFLQTVDTSGIIKGQAPMTQFKTKIQAQQAPATIKFCKALLDDPTLFQSPMADIRLESDQMLLREEFDSKGRFLIKTRPATPPAFTNLVEEEEWERYQLSIDMGRTGLKELIPVRHVVQSVISHFKGEAYVRITTDDVTESLEKLGIGKQHNLAIPTGRTSRRCFGFPSVQGLRYLLKKGNWLTVDDNAVCDECE